MRLALFRQKRNPDTQLPPRAKHSLRNALQNPYPRPKSKRHEEPEGSPRSLRQHAAAGRMSRSRDYGHRRGRLPSWVDSVPVAPLEADHSNRPGIVRSRRQPARPKARVNRIELGQRIFAPRPQPGMAPRKSNALGSSRITPLEVTS